MGAANTEKGFEGGTEPKIFIYFYHPDYASTTLSTCLGTKTYLTDMEGQPYQLFINLPFGELMAEQTGTGYQSPYKFNGKELDPETGLYYYGARYYDPQSSTWLSVDPLAEKYAGWRPYNYCVGNPVVFVDPDGMEIVDAKGIKITYDPKTGWSKNATNDVKIIHSCLMETKTGREQWEKAYTSDNKINMSIVNEKLYDTDGTPALGIAEKPQKFDAKSARYVKSGGIIKVKISLGAINESFDGKNKGLTLREAIAATAGHEIEHTTDENYDLSVKQRNLGASVVSKSDIEKRPSEVGDLIREESRNNHITPMEPIKPKVSEEK